MTGIITNLISFIMKLFSSLMPSGNNQVAGVVQAFGQIKQMIQLADMLIPIDTCIAILLLMMSSAVLYFTIFVVNWIIKRVRGG